MVVPIVLIIALSVLLSTGQNIDSAPTVVEADTEFSGFRLTHQSACYTEEGVTLRLDFDSEALMMVYWLQRLGNVSDNDCHYLYASSAQQLVMEVAQNHYKGFTSLNLTYTDPLPVLRASFVSDAGTLVYFYDFHLPSNVFETMEVGTCIIDRDVKSIEIRTFPKVFPTSGATGWGQVKMTLFVPHGLEIESTWRKISFIRETHVVNDVELVSAEMEIESLLYVHIVEEPTHGGKLVTSNVDVFSNSSVASEVYFCEVRDEENFQKIYAIVLTELDSEYMLRLKRDVADLHDHVNAVPDGEHFNAQNSRDTESEVEGSVNGEADGHQGEDNGESEGERENNGESDDEREDNNVSDDDREASDENQVEGESPCGERSTKGGPACARAAPRAEVFVWVTFCGFEGSSQDRKTLTVRTGKDNCIWWHIYGSDKYHPSLTLLKDGQDILDSPNVVFLPEDGPNVHTVGYLLQDVSDQDAGQYTCIATYGDKGSEWTVTVDIV